MESCGRFLLEGLLTDRRFDLREYARIRGIRDTAFVDALTRALGDISFQEAIAAIDREAESERQTKWIR